MSTKNPLPTPHNIFDIMSQVLYQARYNDIPVHRADTSKLVFYLREDVFRTFQMATREYWHDMRASALDVQFMGVRVRPGGMLDQEFTMRLTYEITRY